MKNVPGTYVVDVLFVGEIQAEARAVGFRTNQQQGKTTSITLTKHLTLEKKKKTERTNQQTK